MKHFDIFTHDHVSGPRRGSNECGIESHVLGAWPEARHREPRHRAGAIRGRKNSFK